MPNYKTGQKMHQSLKEKREESVNLQQLLVFVVEEHEYVLPISLILRTVNIVEITPLPRDSELVSGVINLHGQVIPVINIRKCLNFEDREPRLSDIMLIANVAERTIAFIVDEVKNIVTPKAKDITDMNEILPVVEFVNEVVNIDDKLLPVYNLEKLITHEAEHIAEVMK